jgi:hypothetical protein
MQPKYALYLSVILFTLLLANVSCNNKDPEPAKVAGHISLSFTHLVDGLPLQKDVMKYVNAAGNPYEINQVMYFISDVTLHKSDGTIKLISDWTDNHYVDIDIPSTLTWDVYDDIATGSYDSVSFVFGFTAQKNKSFMFVNPPEVNMMWPDILGGGYHYMMINGSWKDNANVIKSFAFHLGIGQLYKSNTYDNVDSIYAFVQNYFNVKLPNSAFTVEENKTRHIEIIMNIDSWFKTPHIYDHNYWGGAIMQIQPAMQMAKENGFDVFTVGSIQ